MNFTTNSDDDAGQQEFDDHNTLLKLVKTREKYENEVMDQEEIIKNVRKLVEILKLFSKKI